MTGDTPERPICDVCGRHRGVIRIHGFENERFVLYSVCVDCAANDRWPTLVRFERVEEDDILHVVSRLMDMPLIDLRDVAIDSIPLGLVPKWLVVKHRFLPIRVEGNDVVVVFADPFDVAAIHEVEEILERKGYGMRGVIGRERDVDALIERLYDLDK